MLWKKFLTLLDARPLVSFFGFLALLLLLIIIGSMLRRPVATTEAATPEPTLVETYSFGESPKMSFTAKVEKAGVISIYAQTAGIVQKIQSAEGQRVGRGQSLVSLSSNYQGTNIASISREIAQKNAESTTQNFELQRDIIARQRDVANKADIQTNDLRNISRQSMDDTRALITTNQEILDSLQAQLVSDPTNVGLKQQIAGVQSALMGLRSGLRVTEYQTQDSTVSAQLTDISRDITLRQLDLQERGLTLAKEMADLNLKLARASESFMYPATPCSGVVERINVKVGQSVSPGTLIATIKADQGQNTAVVLLTREIAAKVSKVDESLFVIGGKKVGVLPRFVSTEATDGSLYSVLYALPTSVGTSLTNGTSIEVLIPMGSKKIVTDDLYIPLDSVYQTQENSYVYVVDTNQGKEEKAKVKEIEVGEVSGSYVKVASGLSASDIVIVSRNVQQGERVRTE